MEHPPLADLQMPQPRSQENKEQHGTDVPRQAKTKGWGGVGSTAQVRPQHGGESGMVH